MENIVSKLDICWQLRDCVLARLGALYDADIDDHPAFSKKTQGKKHLTTKGLKQPS